LCLGATHVALVLNLDEVYLSHYSTEFDDVPHDVVVWDGLQQSQLSTRLEVIDLFLHFSEQVQVTWVELELSVDVKVVGHLAQGSRNEQHLVLKDEVLEVDTVRVSHEKGDSRFVVNTLQVNLGVEHARGMTQEAVFASLLHLEVSKQ
jgi:hypothetical protein